MRLLFVVQRYGDNVAGGAEMACREFASRMAARGHDVEVVTSCATSYVDWANVLPEGRDEVDGVPVHRLPVDQPRDNEKFGPLNARVVWGHKPVAALLQREWMRLQGPHIPTLEPWLREREGEYDAVICFTYLYFTTWSALHSVGPGTPTVLHPCAHDEPPIYLPIFSAMVRMASSLAFFTEEEEELVNARFRVTRPTAVVGIGADLAASGDGQRFRERFALDDRPYLLYVGRIDEAKGAGELVDYFRGTRNPAVRRGYGQDLALVLLGDPVGPVPDDPDVVVTGFVDEQTKRDAVDGALALAQPSYFESFSMVLTEAWAQRKPALVNAHCAVTSGQARRSGGAIAYRSFAEFDAAVGLLLEDPSVGEALGKAGRDYVELRYQWDNVLDRYERLLSLVARRPARGTSSTGA